MHKSQKLKPSSRLTDHLETREEKEEFLRKYESSNNIIKRIIELLEEDLNKNIRESDSLSNFDKTDWAMYQAAQSGSRREMRNFIKLLNTER